MGLAIAGTILQGLTRNPLAEPGIIGVNAGASVAAVTLIVLFPKVPPFVLPYLPLVVRWLSLCHLSAGLGHKGSAPIRLILIGVGMAAVLNAVTT
jgi:iron complex transport system permease protein